MTTIAERITGTEARLALYIAAEQQVMKAGQSYSIGNRSLTRADHDYITKMIVRLNNDLNKLRRGSPYMRQYVVPRDY